MSAREKWTQTWTRSAHRNCHLWDALDVVDLLRFYAGTRNLDPDTVSNVTRRISTVPSSLPSTLSPSTTHQKLQFVSNRLQVVQFNLRSHSLRRGLIKTVKIFATLLNSRHHPFNGRRSSNRGGAPDYALYVQ
ncbi:uncharacterized protein AtWU_10837 [Aspergillus tubingensis]|uniref:uncharacterized protein n=1 Tax=Aspergillus tubingensis TaxID=5068 RepID=UPI001577BF27|nr:uncharacterized protein AtWU_10837 [Aspergillus tubingensis]GFN21029.1 hypothetical protein AtWU_10837 [Aspergillus tubingensis]